MSESSTDYRPDIDGLRALAVLGVIGFHAAPGYVTGGFIGVDVFFVISGFLISTIILREMDRGDFSLASFYARRIRRLLPALAVVLCGTALLGWFYLLPHEFAALGKHLLAGSTFVSNYVLKREAGYFDLAVDQKPLLHLWSLGIEEQFYVLWPLLLMTVRNRRALLVVVSIIVAASFAACVHASYRNASSAFFLPQFRIWELGTGTLLAILVGYGRIGERLPPKGAAVLSALGLAVLVACGYLLGSRSVYPGYLALWPVAGACLIIAAGPSNPVSRLALSHPRLVGIGLVSYPLYLWHWPLLSFAHILGVADDWRVIASLVLAAFILALLTHLYVERPMRRAPRAVVAPIMAAVACVALLAVGIRHAMIEPRLNAPQLAEVGAASSDWAFPLGLTRDRRVPEFKFYRAGTRRETVVFIGDSHAQQYWPRVQRLTSAAGAPAVLFATRGGCAPIRGLDYRGRPDCLGLVERTLAVAAEPDVSTVVFSAAWFMYFGRPEMEMRGVGDMQLGSPGWRAALDQLTAEMRGLVSKGKRVYLVLGSPIDLSPGAMLQRTLAGAVQVSTPSITAEQVASRWGATRDGLKAAAFSAGAQVIDPIASVCTQAGCSSVDATGRPMYRDANHLRASYVREHASFMDETMGLSTASIR